MTSSRRGSRPHALNDLSSISLASSSVANRADEYKLPFRRLQTSTWLSFEFTMSVCQFVGFCHVILTSFFYGRANGGVDYDNTQNYHGIFMTYGLVFFNGEALLAYRFLRNEKKLISKFIHVSCHMLAIGFFSAALAQIVHVKNMHHNTHAFSFHSWFGFGIMIAYIVQFLFGLVNYAFPGVPLETRAALMPYHRATGLILFGCSVAQTLLGNLTYWALVGPDVLGSCYFYLDCDTHMDLIYNFSLVSLVVYGILVVILVSKDDWKRLKTPDEMK